MLDTQQAEEKGGTGRYQEAVVQEPGQLYMLACIWSNNEDSQVSQVQLTVPGTMIKRVERT